MLENIKIPVVSKKVINEYESKYQIGEIDGRGTMSCIDVYEGIQVIYNDFHCFNAPSDRTDRGNRYIEINHCLKGKFECQYNRNYYAYLCQGDLAISCSSLSKLTHSFPLGYYQGVELLIEVDQAKNIPLFKEFKIDLKLILKRLMSNKNIYIFKATKQIEHICLEMYNIEESVKREYLKIKVLELLLFLSHHDFGIITNEKRYYPKKQIEIIKAIKTELSQDLSIKINLEQLTNQYHINLNTFRKAFKEIHSKPVYQWLKEYRLEYSMELLKSTNKPIIEIANEIGYSNPSKYSAAFYQYVKMTPLQYRKSYFKMD